MLIGLPQPACTFNGTTISRHILGVECTRQSEMEIRNACSAKRNITVCISVDDLAMFAEVEPAEVGYCNIL